MFYNYFNLEKVLKPNLIFLTYMEKLMVDKVDKKDKNLFCQLCQWKI